VLNAVSGLSGGQFKAYSPEWEKRYYLIRKTVKYSAAADFETGDFVSGAIRDS